MWPFWYKLWKRFFRNGEGGLSDYHDRVRTHIKVPTLFGAMSYTSDEQKRIDVLIRNFILTLNQFKSQLNGKSSSSSIIDQKQEGSAISEEKTIEIIIGLSISELEKNFNFILLNKQFLNTHNIEKINTILMKFRINLNELLLYNQDIKSI